MTKKICISGYYGFNNFGDETILKILVENLKKFDCKPEITVFSSNPAETSVQFDVNSVYSFNIKSVFKQIKMSDCLISGGGSLLQDKTSKKSLIYYLLLLFIAQFFRKKTIIFAQGIGPINNGFLKYITMMILKHADFITVRDKNSYNLLKKYNINAQICSDPVWNIDIQKIQNTGKIGVQLRDFSAITENFIKELAFCINKYYFNKEICLLSLQNKSDLEVLNKLKSQLLNQNSNIKTTVIENTSNEKIINDINQMEAIIAMRYHACLVAIKAGVKLLPVNYDIKVETLAKDFNLEYLEMNDDIQNKFEKFADKNIIYDEEKIKFNSFDFNKLEENI